MPSLPSLLPRDRAFFDLFDEAGRNTLKAALQLKQMLDSWPDERELASEILRLEQEGDRITHEIANRLNSTFVTPLDRDDIYGLATQLDDVVDYIEETADLLGLYRVEAPMGQAQALAEVLVKSCEQLAAALNALPGMSGLQGYWVEIDRLEKDGDRIFRDAVAALFERSLDPMFVVRWKDILTTVERAIDATESAAHTLESIVLKNS